MTLTSTSKGRLLSFAALVAMMFLAACGGDGTTQPEDSLSADQVKSMAGALTSLIALSLFARDANVTAPVHFNARSMLAETQPFTASGACPEGGRIGIQGAFSPDGSGGLLFTLSDTLVDCGIKDNKSTVWIFTSQPTLEISILEEFGDSTEVPQLTVQQTDVGRVRYSSGSLSGACSMNLVFHSEYSFRTPTADSTTISLHTTGTLCGRAQARDTSITIAVPSPP